VNESTTQAVSESKTSVVTNNACDKNGIDVDEEAVDTAVLLRLGNADEIDIGQTIPTEPVMHRSRVQLYNKSLAIIMKLT
jgi:hypothetical protein